jgi:hypothetical protein
MKILRIIATIVVGGYLLAMGLQLFGVTLALVKDLSGIAPGTSGAHTAFFPNLLVCTLCTLLLWAIWRKKKRPAASDPKSTIAA